MESGCEAIENDFMNRNLSWGKEKKERKKKKAMEKKKHVIEMMKMDGKQCTVWTGFICETKGLMFVVNWSGSDVLEETIAVLRSWFNEIRRITVVLTKKGKFEKLWWWFWIVWMLKSERFWNSWFTDMQSVTFGRLFWIDCIEGREFAYFGDGIGDYLTEKLKNIDT